jgi:hypothetical protein
VPYPLQPVSELQEYILSNMQAAGDVHEMYEKSLAVEPREREDEKIVRYVGITTVSPYCAFVISLQPSRECWCGEEMCLLKMWNYRVLAESGFL